MESVDLGFGLNEYDSQTNDGFTDTDTSEQVAATVHNLIEEIELGDDDGDMNMNDENSIKSNESNSNSNSGTGQPDPNAADGNMDMKMEFEELSSNNSSGSRDPVRRSDRDILQNLQFMNNFDPSKRREQKRRRRYNIDGLGRPQLLPSDLEGCDCLDPECPGCHFPCPTCGDCKCGHECRVGRKWVYESIEVEGRHCTTRTHPIVKTNGFSNSGSS